MLAGSFSIKVFIQVTLCSSINHPVTTPGERASPSPKSCMCSWAKGENKEKLSLFAFFPQYHQTQQQQRGSVLLMLDNISWSDFSPDLPLSRRTRDILRSPPAPVPLRVPKPPQSPNTQQMSQAGIPILLHITRTSGTRTQGVHGITGA